jgi:outer membrane receptor protein involved in Fe transport
MKKTFLLYLTLLFSLLTAGAAEAVPGSIKGKVIDAATKAPIEFANVSISKKQGGQVLKGTITDANGRFILGDLATGSYVLSVSYIGYNAHTQTINLSDKQRSLNLPNIALKEDSKVMNEVEVVGQKSQMRFEIDKKVFNVDQSIANTGGSASDILTNIPSVDVDNEGTISLRGSSSVTVWINGKASGLSSDNRGEILEQMPAESIERIEVITNPSAKFSPEGTAGIINIILKKDRKAGYYGSLQAGGQTNGGANASGNINYSSGVLDAYANVGYRRRKNDGGGNTTRNNTSSNTYLNQHSDSDNQGNNLFTRMGLTWHATSKDDFSVNGMGMFGGHKEHSEINYVSGSLLTDQVNYNRLRHTASNNDMTMYNFDFGYRHEFGKEHTLDITVARNHFEMDKKSIYDQTTNYTDTSIDPLLLYQHQLNDVKKNGWEFQLDYSNQLSKKTKIEAGYKGTLSKENSPVETYEGTTAANATLNEQLYNIFQYNQDIHALYATFSTKFNKLGVQLGLRGEYSKVKTHSLAYGEKSEEVTPYKKDYYSLFPSLFLSYALPHNNELQLNYTRRISRPWGGQLNSFKNITDATNISFGNPELDPQYSNAFELNFLKMWDLHTLSFSGYYRTTDNVTEQIRYLQGEVMYSTYENVASSKSSGIEIVAKNKLFHEVIDLTTTLNGFYYELDGFSYQMAGVESPITGDRESDFSWNVKMIANTKLPLGTTLQLTGNYNAKKVVAQGYRQANYTLDAGLRKNFFNKTISVSVNGRDLLNSRKWHTITSGEGFHQDSKNWRGSRRFGLTVTYNFGNMRAKQNKSRKNDGEIENPYQNESEY